MSAADAANRVSDRARTTLVPATFTTVYPTPPEVAPPNASLPAAFTRVTSGIVSYSASQRQVVHTIELVVLVSRTDNLTLDYDTALPLIEPFIEMMEQFTTLGDARYFDAKVTGYEIGPASFTTASDTGGDAQYLAVVLTTTVKEKIAVTMH